MGEDWRGIMDFDPVKLSRDKIIRFCAEVDTQAIRDIFPVGSPRAVAAKLKGFADAGMRVVKFMDYGGMAGAKFGATSAMKVREAEDELLLMCRGEA
jgi:phthiodiolone/phenolphthiodiolone dimycocerosates ketoreductase